MTTRTTFHLNISRPALTVARIRAWLAQRDPILVLAFCAVPLIGLLLGGALWRVARPAETVTSAPLAPIMIVQTARAVAVPTAVPTATPRMITAYDQPNGIALGPIPEPQMSAIVARWGDGWLQTTWDNAPVWIMAADLGANLADVRPVPSVQIAPVQAPPAPMPVEQPSYRVANQPQPSGIVITEQERAAGLIVHQAQQAAWCDSGGADAQPAYCQAVRQWMSEHR